MKFFAIGDLHLSGNPPKKPMDIFGPHWTNHWHRIKEDWLSKVHDEDVVFLVGDISWGLKLTEAITDLQEIAALPGQKYMIRGNHDYWWSSVSKMENAVNKRITFLQGHGLAINDVAFGGTRAYLCPRDPLFKASTDTAIYERELLRTEAALKEIVNTGASTRILLLHYPPFNDKIEPSGFTQLLQDYKVDHCIFGHLHDQISFERLPDSFENTKLHLVSADYMEFTLKEIL